MTALEQARRVIETRLSELERERKQLLGALESLSPSAAKPAKARSSRRRRPAPAARTSPTVSVLPAVSARRSSCPTCRLSGRVDDRDRAAGRRRSAAALSDRAPARVRVARSSRRRAGTGRPRRARRPPPARPRRRRRAPPRGRVLRARPGSPRQPPPSPRASGRRRPTALMKPWTRSGSRFRVTSTPASRSASA